jgi:hypothetical protein
METQVRTPQMVFMQPQRLVVPLFQRPYVWNEENQWEPLWNDVVRVAERVLENPSHKHHPHFLGAVVLQQVQKQTGAMQERTVIDGQQRLTTLQLMMDALHNQLLEVDARPSAMRLEPLVVNAEPFCTKPEDRFKVWPTNRDRGAFNTVMGAAPPVDYGTLGHTGERIVAAHRYFNDRAREWLHAAGTESVQSRAATIETVLRDLIQLVVIDLTVDENAQEIFETLNARGAQLTAADLIKNFVFQRLLESGANVEQAYEAHWKEFETGFWEMEVSVGRLKYPRSSLFLNHWLVSKTGGEVVAREVFDQFKRFAHRDHRVGMELIVEQVAASSTVYKRFITASQQSGPVDRLGLFGYRTGVLESEVIKPLILHVFDPDLPVVPEAQVTKLLDAVESWMVRRMLVRASTKSYSQIVAEIIGKIGGTDRMRLGDVIESHLASQTSESRYWPDDHELRAELTELAAYRRLGRGRLRMILESVEDHLRGWRAGKSGIGEERTPRGKFAIEHVMPRKWAAHWPLDPVASNDVGRDHLIHTLGNLTLLTKRLNSKVSNGPWLGDSGKRSGLNEHDVLFVNRELLKHAADSWTEEKIRERTQLMIEMILQVWPVPVGHRSGFIAEKPSSRRKVDLSDLINAGVLHSGMSLFPRRKKHSHQVATLLPDGRIAIDDLIFASPSTAATHVAGGRINGWGFFLTDQKTRTSLRGLRQEYINELQVDDDDEGPEDDGDEEESEA